MTTPSSTNWYDFHPTHLFFINELAQSQHPLVFSRDYWAGLMQVMG